MTKHTVQAGMIAFEYDADLPEFPYEGERYVILKQGDLYKVWDKKIQGPAATPHVFYRTIERARIERDKLRNA